MRKLALLACFAISCSGQGQLPDDELVGVQVVGALRSDGQFLYYMVDPTGGPLELWRVRVADRATMKLAALEQGPTDDELVPFEIDSSFAYVPINGHLLRVPLTGGSADTLLDLGNALWITAVTIGVNDVYLDVGPLMYTRSDGIIAVSKQGGTSRLLGEASTSADAWNIREVASDGHAIYMPATSDLSHANDLIIAATEDTGDVSTIASSQERPIATAVHGSQLFWLDLGAGDGSFGGNPTAALGDIMDCDTTVPCAPQIVAGQLPLRSAPGSGVFPSTLVSPEAGAIFWNDATGVHEAGSATLDVLDTHVRLFTVDATHVFWANDDGVFFRPR
ncbi:MAG TPA: hypothetical protein VGH28_02810 [Polyangiaceae bacterium]